MGCDIHLWVEVYENDMWIQPPEFMMKNPYYRPNSNDDDDDEREKMRQVPFYKDRNYALFAILAGVRDSMNQIVPISYARGMPLNASPEFRRKVDSWGVDGHSHSWHSLDILEDYDWDREFTYRSDGALEVKAYHELASNFYTETMPALSALARERELEEYQIRIVFFFDN